MTFEESVHEHERRKLWRMIACAGSSSSNVTESKVVITWADKVLAAYDERFPKPIPSIDRPVYDSQELPLLKDKVIGDENV